MPVRPSIPHDPSCNEQKADVFHCERSGPSNECLDLHPPNANRSLTTIAMMHLGVDSTDLEQVIACVPQ